MKIESSDGTRRGVSDALFGGDGFVVRTEDCLLGRYLRIDTRSGDLLGPALSEAAYMAEIVRAGMQSVDPGQAEAAAALGMGRTQTLRRIVLPQAMRVIVPPTGNETIAMLKDTVLAAYVPISVLKGVDLRVRPGEVSVLIGPSGSGKSTFLRCINNLEKINAGRIQVDGELVGYRQRGQCLYEMKERQDSAPRRDPLTGPARGSRPSVSSPARRTSVGRPRRPSRGGTVRSRG